MSTFYHYHFINLKAHVLIHVSIHPCSFPQRLISSVDQRGARNAPVCCSQPPPAWGARWWNRSEPLITSEQRNAALSFLRTADTEQAQHTQMMTKSPARWIRWSPRGLRVIFALHCRWGFNMNEIRSFYLLIEASRMCSAAWIPAASGPSCRHPESCSLERFLTKFCFSLMNSSKCATEPGSFFGQCVGNRFSLIHMSALIRADAPPLPRLLHTFRLLWQSLISLDLDGSVAENAGPKLPLTADNRPPPSHLSIPSCLPPHHHHHHPPLSCLISPSFSSRVFSSPLPPLITCFFFFFSVLDHVPHTPGCPPGPAACSAYTNNLARSDRPVMACGSADTEGGSPKASQAINDSFPPYSSINKQVVEVNPGEAVIFT